MLSSTFNLYISPSLRDRSTTPARKEQAAVNLLLPFGGMGYWEESSITLDPEPGHSESCPLTTRYRGCLLATPLLQLWVMAVVGLSHWMSSLAMAFYGHSHCQSTDNDHRHSLDLRFKYRAASPFVSFNTSVRVFKECEESRSFDSRQLLILVS